MKKFNVEAKSATKLKYLLFLREILGSVVDVAR